MLEHFLFNELRDTRKALATVEKGTFKQLYNQMNLAKQSGITGMENIFYDNFTDTLKTDNRTSADFLEDHYTIKQNKRTFDDTGYALAFTENFKAHEDNGITAHYYEENGVITVNFVQDESIVTTYTLNGWNPHVNSNNGIFYIAYEVEETFRRSVYRRMDHFGNEYELAYAYSPTDYNSRNPFVYLVEENPIVIYLSDRNGEYWIKTSQSDSDNLLKSQAEISNIQCIFINNTLYTFYEDMNNGVRQLCYFKTPLFGLPQSVIRITEEEKEEKEYELIEKEGKFHLFSLCLESGYLQGKHTIINKDEVVRNTITNQNQNVDKFRGTINEEGRYTYYIQTGDRLNIRYDHQSFHIGSVSYFFVLAKGLLQKLYVSRAGQLEYKPFDELYLEGDILHTHSPEDDSNILSIDIESLEEFQTVHLYIEQDNELLNVRPFVNFRDQGETFYEFEYVNEQVKEGIREIHYSIVIPPSKKMNLKFELTVNDRNNDGKFLGYGLTFI